MKKIFILFLFIILAATCYAQKLIYAPYYGAVGSMTNGKVSWGRYEELSSSSIIVSHGKIEFNTPGSKLSFKSYSSVKKGKTAKGNPYFYYEGLRNENGTKANVRIDFTEEWTIISLYLPSIAKPNCLKFNCKQLAEMP